MKAKKSTFSLLPLFTSHWTASSASAGSACPHMSSRACRHTDRTHHSPLPLAAAARDRRVSGRGHHNNSPRTRGSCVFSCTHPPPPDDLLPEGRPRPSRAGSPCRGPGLPATAGCCAPPAATARSGARLHRNHHGRPLPSPLRRTCGYRRRRRRTFWVVDLVQGLSPPASSALARRLFSLVSIFLPAPCAPRTCSRPWRRPRRG